MSVHRIHGKVKAERGAGGAAAGGGRSCSYRASSGGAARSEDQVMLLMMKRLHARSVSHGFLNVQVGRGDPDFKFATWDGVKSPRRVYIGAGNSAAITSSGIRGDSALSDTSESVIS